jgi:16S rRNA (cytidine1402-2'-O)-methyltransferase
MTSPTHHLKPGLYIIPTPIGHLEDITLRAINTLNAVDEIYCEDTRVSSKLLKHFSISKPLKIYNDHSLEKDRERIIQKAAVKGIALISDAGTPLISDPGYKLLQRAYANDIHITVLPGACAAITGLVLSGFPNDQFTYFGFFNDKKIDLYKAVNGTLVFYESPHSILKTLDIISLKMSNRNVAICREMTKLFEEVIKGSTQDVIKALQEKDAIRGEIVLILSPAEQAEITDEDIIKALEKATTPLKGKDAISYVADEWDVPKKRVYQLYTQFFNIEG